MFISDTKFVWVEEVTRYSIATDFSLKNFMLQYFPLTSDTENCAGLPSRSECHKWDTTTFEGKSKNSRHVRPEGQRHSRKCFGVAGDQRSEKRRKQSRTIQQALAAGNINQDACEQLLLSKIKPVWWSIVSGRCEGCLLRFFELHNAVCAIATINTHRLLKTLLCGLGFPFLLCRKWVCAVPFQNSINHGWCAALSSDSRNAAPTSSHRQFGFRFIRKNFHSIDTKKKVFLSIFICRSKSGSKEE